MYKLLAFSILLLLSNFAYAWIFEIFDYTEGQPYDPENVIEHDENYPPLIEDSQIQVWEAIKRTIDASSAIP